MQRRHFDTIIELPRALKDIALPSLPSGRPRESSFKTVLSTWRAQKMLYRETEWFFFCYFVTTFAPKESPSRTLKQQEAFSKEAPQRKDTTTTPITLATTAIQQIWPGMQRQPPVASLTFKRMKALVDGLNPRRLYTTIEDVPLRTLYDSPFIFITPCAVNVLAAGAFIPAKLCILNRGHCKPCTTWGISGWYQQGRSSGQYLNTGYRESSQPICIFITSGSK